MNHQGINLSSISRKSMMARLLRFPLRLIPPKMVVPILQGRLKGKKWIVGSGNHGCWIGSYEYEKQTVFSRIIEEGGVLYDIGAHVGFYTLLASEIVGPKGKVFAFEPLPKNINYLKEHLRLNHCKNVTVVEAAVAGRSGMAFFENGANSYMGRLSAQSRLEVRMISLDDLVARGEILPPDYVKIDVEGAELQVLYGGKLLIAKYHPTIFLATHGIEVHRRCCVFLKEAGYHLQSLKEKQRIDESDEILAFKKT